MAEPTYTSDYDYHLPEDRIAKVPLEPRDSSKLMIIDRKESTISHHTFHELPGFLQTGDLLVINNSKVFKCRLRGTVGEKQLELFLLRKEEDAWIALAQPGRILKPSSHIELAGGVAATVKEKHEDGTIRVVLPLGDDEVFAYTETHGEVPLPPYIEQSEKADASYQTAYAEKIGSAAAPTAGFHFTERLLNELKSRGVRVAPVTLHVGLGTFQPIKSDTLEGHKMHTEFFEVPEETMKLIEETRARGGKVIAVGTTSLRALESAALGKKLSTDLFIHPGFTFKVVDALITNFHLPKSTLLVLIRTFGGSELMISAYEEAIKNGYRFYSYGDAMLIA